MANPIRRLIQRPERILQPFIREAMTVLDFGSAMGFFSLPLARMVGPRGRVFCVDVQERMLDSLGRRARKAGLADRLELRLCGEESFGLGDLQGQVDFALAFAVVHEVADPKRLFSDLGASLKPDGRFLFVEPKGHVSADDFARSESLAERAGLMVVEHPPITRSHAALFSRRT